MPENDSDILAQAESLIRGYDLEKASLMKQTLKDTKENVIRSLENDPIRTIGIAFSLGYASTRLIQSPDVEAKRDLAKTLGAALIYGLMSPMIESAPHEPSEKLH